MFPKRLKSTDVDHTYRQENLFIFIQENKKVFLDKPWRFKPQGMNSGYFFYVPRCRVGAMWPPGLSFKMVIVQSIHLRKPIVKYKSAAICTTDSALSSRARPVPI